MAKKAPETRPRPGARVKPRLPRAPLPRQTGGAHEDRTRRPVRKAKYRVRPDPDE
jgi:hypothetical protein